MYQRIHEEVEQKHTQNAIACEVYYASYERDIVAAVRGGGKCVPIRGQDKSRWWGGLPIHIPASRIP